MNKPKFNKLCERVLIPKFDKVVGRQLHSLKAQTQSTAELIDMVAGALARLEGKIDRLSSPGATEDAESTIR